MTAAGAPVAKPPVHKIPTVTNYDMVRDGAVKAANWLGRQVQCLSGTVQSAVSKIVQMVKPLFNSILKVVREAYKQSRDIIIANKEVAIPVAIFSVVAVILALGFNHLCCEQPSGEGTLA